MAGSTTLGKALKCNFERSEDDTDDIILRLRDVDGVLIDTTNFTAVMVLDVDGDDVADHTFNGTGSGVDGLITLDFSTFAAPIGDYTHDITITDTTGAQRVYFRGSFKVVERIGT